MNQTQIMNMLALQAGMNAKVNKDWLKAGYPFLRAVVIEGSEAMEHYGWKWWKAQDRDMAQFRIELVDIWHFMLSHTLVECHGNWDHAAVVIADQLRSPYMHTGITFDGKYYQHDQLSLLSRLELMMGLAAARRISVPLFATLMKDAGMSWADLYIGYVSKNVLNFFRQDNGYKDGTYIKMWARTEDPSDAPVEDNVILAEIVAGYDTDHPDFADLLYSRLQEHYDTMVKPKPREVRASDLAAVTAQ